MLVLGGRKQTAKWDEAGVELDLVPLTADKDQEFVEQTITEVRDGDGKLVTIRRDHARYAQLVGRHCIQGWRGVVDEAGNAVECTPESIDRFMLIDQAQAFVFSRVKGLAIHLAEEVEAGKNG